MFYSQHIPNLFAAWLGASGGEVRSVHALGPGDRPPDTGRQEQGEQWAPPWAVWLKVKGVTEFRGTLEFEDCTNYIGIYVDNKTVL